MKFFHKPVLTRQSGIRKASLVELAQHFYRSMKFAYLLVDDNWRLLEFSPTVQKFGYSDVKVGKDIRGTIDFLIGIKVKNSFELPVVTAPNRVPTRVIFFPEKGRLYIVLIDVRAEYEQRKLVQQKANENELLLIEQQRLTNKLQTAQRQLRDKNKELENASRLQTGFLSGASHEFRTPLASMLGYVQLLRQRFEKQPVSKSLSQIKVIRRTARHLLSLVENLLDHGKLNSAQVVLNPAPTHLQELCEEIVKSLSIQANKKHIRLIDDYLPNPLPISLIDSSRLQQIMFNIVGNAIKFTDSGEVKVEFFHTQEELKILVTDTGIGIANQNMEDIFQPFWQADQLGRVGIGLGLTITNKIIELMGGELNISSELGKGTQVTIQLPAPEVDDIEYTDSTTLVELDSDWHFLLVEDDLDIALLMQALLTDRGIKVTHVDNGRKAIEALRDRAIDLVLMDLQMPIMNGYQATIQMRKLGYQQPILVMTASALDEDQTMAEQAGCDGYLLKPVMIDEVLRLADQLIEKVSDRV